MAEECPEDAHWLVPSDADFLPEDWHQIYFDAFDALRYDRYYGAFGGEMPIYYSAISQYAADHGITGNSFATFRYFMGQLEAEYALARQKPGA